LQATQEVVSRLPLTTGAEFNAAVQAAKDAFPAWRSTPVPTRTRVMLKFQELIRQNWVRSWRAYLRDAARHAMHFWLMPIIGISLVLLLGFCNCAYEIVANIYVSLQHCRFLHFHLLQDELAKSVTLEQGKTFQDAKGDVFRGLGEHQLNKVMLLGVCLLTFALGHNICSVICCVCKIT